MKSGQSGWKICDEEANDFLTPLQEAAVGIDQTDEVKNDVEEETEILEDSNEDSGNLDNHFRNFGSRVDDDVETLDYDDDNETRDCDEIISDGDDDDYVDE